MKGGFVRWKCQNQVRQTPAKYSGNITE